MSRQIALLRGINLGTHNRIGMADLRAVLVGLGHSDVRTHLRSGNAVLTAATPPDRTAQAIRDAIAARFGLDVPVVVRTAGELAAVLAADPFGAVATDPARYLVRFHDVAPDPELLAALDPARYEPERFAAVGREVYLWLPGGVQRSRLAAAVERAAGTGTARNWRTVAALVELAR